MNIFDFFHLIGGFEIFNNLSLFLLNSDLFLVKLFDKLRFFLIVEFHIIIKLLNLVIGLYNEILEINGSLFVPLNLLLDFPHFGELRLFVELLLFEFILYFIDFLVLKSLELLYVLIHLDVGSLIINIVFIAKLFIFTLKSLSLI
jgi:hypothetical protein